MYPPLSIPKAIVTQQGIEFGGKIFVALRLSSYDGYCKTSNIFAWTFYMSDLYRGNCAMRKPTFPNET